ncbi:MAG: endonuclease MutS2 [Capsulimonas sp.]|uniref:endonuclease MutS2 n=1 Tax=Capsulimonas sp. TaxID=2494211 RepID=UPI003267D35B
MDNHALRVLEFDAIRHQLMDLTACSLGRELAEAMEPSDYLLQVKARLDETTECRQMIEIKGNLPLGGITDIRPHLRQAEIGSSLDPRGLLDIYSTAAGGRVLKAFLQKIATDYPIMAALAANLGQFPSLESEITSSIGPNGLILDSASPDLARIRSRRKVANQRMLERLNAIINGPLRAMLQDPVIVQRGDRYCVPVKADHRGAFGGIVHDTSASGATLFMEPQSVVDYGNELKELDIKETQEIAKILMRLTESVRRISAPLMVSVGILAQIDFISARAKMGMVQNATAPALNTNGYTRLVSARHPLIDPAIVVPIDVELGGEKNQLLLITGPNTGGKTVTLKTMGLLTLMAQCGLHVPAAHAEMNLFYQIYADIGDEQSLQQSLSTFSGHISNIVKILKTLRKNALVLLDEVGAGTDPGEGASLARAILDHLREAGARVIATTHYGELKSYAFVTPGVQNASVEFDEATLSPTYRLLQGVPGSSNAFAIAGRLGMPESVLAEARTELTGTDSTADLFRELEEGRRQAVAEGREAERARIESQMLRRRYQEELANLESLRRDARLKAAEEARALIKRAQDKVDNIIGQLRHANTEGKQTERARQAIRNIADDLQNDIERQTEEQMMTIIEIVPNRLLRQGDKVRIPSLGMTGEVLEDERAGESGSNLPVQVGAMRVSVPASTLRLIGEPDELPVVKIERQVPLPPSLATSPSAPETPAKPPRNGQPERSGPSERSARGERPARERTPKPERSPRTDRAPRPERTPTARHSASAPPDRPKLLDIHAGDQQNIAMQKTMGVTSQISLLGQRADEAVRNVEKYIDDAYAAGLTHARVVHGKGTGALRRAVQDFLKDNPLVAEYTTANADEGGAGATVVKLRET